MAAMPEPTSTRIGVERGGSISLKSTATGRCVLTRATAGGGTGSRSAAGGTLKADSRSGSSAADGFDGTTGAGDELNGELMSGSADGPSETGVSGFGAAYGTLGDGGNGTRPS